MRLLGKPESVVSPPRPPTLIRTITWQFELSPTGRSICTAPQTCVPTSRPDLITHCLQPRHLKRIDAMPTLESVVARSYSMAGKPGIDQAYLQRWCGLFLTGSPNTHELLIAYLAPTPNGKSVIHSRHALRPRWKHWPGVAPGFSVPDRQGTAKANIRQRLPTCWAAIGDRIRNWKASATMRLHLLKRLTGDATIKARFMRQDFFGI